MLRILGALLALLLAAPATHAAKDECVRQWKWTKKGGGYPIFYWKQCVRASGNSGYYDIFNNSRTKAKICWKVVFKNGKESEGCRTMDPKEKGSATCWMCAPKNSGGVKDVFLTKFQPLGPDGKPRGPATIEGGQVADGARAGKAPPPVGRPGEPNIVDVPKDGHLKYGTRGAAKAGGAESCGVDPASMAQFAAYSTDPAVMRGRLGKLTSMLECLEKQPSSAEVQGLKQTIGMLKQAMGAMAR